MNFISHFYCHQNENPEFNFGLLFPDFLGIISRKYKLHQFEADYTGKSQAFLNGIVHHKLADEKWHYNAYFETKTQAIKRILAEFGMADKPYRPFFMTHVMLELLLDRQIVRFEKSVAENMYKSLEAIDASFLKSLFQDEKLTEKFLPFFKNFTENRYTLTYADNEMFVYALNRLFSRVGNPMLNLAETNNFVQRLDLVVENDYINPLHSISNERIS